MVCYDIYSDQLRALGHGLALWEPNPNDLSQQVDIGDVGFVLYGGFQRLFNIHLAADHPCQGTPLPEYFEPLDLSPAHVYGRILRPGSYLSRSVVEADVSALSTVATTGGQASLRFRCSRQRGGVLVLPDKANREDTKYRGAYEKYIRTHCDRWFALTKMLELNLRQEDIILVTGCDKTTSWATAAFVDREMEGGVSLQVGFAGIGSASLASSLTWTQHKSAQYNWGPDVDAPPSTDPARIVGEGGTMIAAFEDRQVLQRPINTNYNQCVFVRGYRAKTRHGLLPVRLKAAATPIPYPSSSEDNMDPDGDGLMSSHQIVNMSDDEMEDSHVRSMEDADNEHTEMIAPILDYILENSGVDLAIAHDDDLKPYVEDATCASDVAARLKEIGQSVVRTVDGITYGCIEHLDEHRKLAEPQERGRKPLRVTLQTENIRYYSPPSQSPMSPTPSPTSTSHSGDRQSRSSYRSPVRSPVRMIPRAVSPSYTTDSFAGPSRGGRAMSPSARSSYTNASTATVYYSGPSDTPKPVLKTLDDAMHMTDSELQAWAGISHRDLEQEIHPTTDLLRSFVPKLNRILYKEDLAEEQPLPLAMITRMVMNERSGPSLDKQLILLGGLINAFEAGKQSEDILALPEFVFLMDEAGPKYYADSDEFTRQKKYPAMLLKLALHSHFDVPANPKGRISDIIGTVFPALPATHPKHSRNFVGPMFTVSFADIVSAGFHMTGTYCLDEHLQINGNSVKVFRLSPAIVSALHSYRGNRVAIALGIEDIGDEILSSWKALLEGYSGDALERDLQMNTYRVRQLASAIMFLKSVSPSIFAERERRLEASIQSRRAWHNLVINDLDTMRRSDPHKFYGAFARVIAFGLIFLQVWFFMNNITKVLSGRAMKEKLIEV